MSLSSVSDFPVSSRRRRILCAVLFTAAALTLVSLVFFFSYLEDCASVASWKFCKFSTHLTERAVAVFVLGGLFGFARPQRVRTLVQAMGSPIPLAPIAALILAGGGLVLTPLGIWGRAPSGDALLAAVSLWAAGVAVLALAAVWLLAPWRAWTDALARGGPLLWSLLALGLLLPEIGDTLFPLWHTELVTDVTFSAVQWVAAGFGLDLVAIPSGYILGHEDFWIKVGQSCSGIEGFALLTVFMTGYTALFWRQLSPGRVALMLPVGLALSWGFNVLRIAGLIWIGVNVSPVLAIEGFHSHAGWLMFSLLSLGIVAVVHSTAWFRRNGTPAAGRADAPPLPPFFADWNAARIVPFAVFMFSALLASTFVSVPALAYPARFAAMAGALWLFRRQIAALPWRLLPAAAIAGAVIGVAWLATTPALASDDGALAGLLAAMTPGLFVVWVLTRTLGTTVLVPVIEELFFRSYLLDRFGAGRSVVMTLIAVAVSTAAFALLHDRWIAAALAGVVFAWLALRPGGRIVDAIVAHMVANGLIAAWALVQGNWAVI